MSKRLEKLLALVESGSTEAFVLYGLAMEYRSADQIESALATFERLRSAHPDYLPMYLICGQMLVDSDDEARARGWLEAGLELATRQGDAKAKSELSGVLALL